MVYLSVYYLLGVSYVLKDLSVFECKKYVKEITRIFFIKLRTIDRRVKCQGKKINNALYKKKLIK